MRTGTTHWINVWDELYCGRENDPATMFYTMSKGRATCATCRKAGDSSMGDVAAGGSPARRW